jgi:hypothetical protein
MNDPIEKVINLLERYIQFPYYDEKFPEDKETKYCIDKLKEKHKCENCSNWGQAFKTANDCKFGITDGEYQNGTNKNFYCNKHKIKEEK